MRLWGQIVKLVLWNSEDGLWNSGDGLWNLWNSEEKLWNSGERLWNWYCDSLQRDGETLGGNCFRGTAKLCRQIRKLWNSKFHNQSLKSQNATSKFHNLTFENHYKSWSSLPCCSSSLAPFFDRPRPNSFPQRQDALHLRLHSRLSLVEAPSQFEVPWGWEFWYHFNLVDTPSQFEVPRGWKFDIILTLWTLKVSLKFHGGEFDITLTLWTLQVSLKFHGGGILTSS